MTSLWVSVSYFHRSRWFWRSKCQLCLEVTTKHHFAEMINLSSLMKTCLCWSSIETQRLTQLMLQPVYLSSLCSSTRTDFVITSSPSCAISSGKTGCSRPLAWFVFSSFPYLSLYAHYACRSVLFSCLFPVRFSLKYGFHYCIMLLVVVKIF